MKLLSIIHKDVNKKVVYSVGILLFLIVVVEIVATSVIPMWRDQFYSALTSKDVAGYAIVLVYFTILMGTIGIVQGLKAWVGQRLSFEYRKSGTKVLNKLYNDAGKKVDGNHTQPQTEALHNATVKYLEVSLEVFISGAIVVILIVSNIHNPTLLIAAIIYTIIISIVSALFSKPLIRTDTELQHAEGLFREAILELRTLPCMGKLIYSYLNYTRVVMYFTLFARVKGNLGALVPYILFAPAFFAGTQTLGQFMGAAATFELIVINSTILVMVYPTLTKARASAKIVENFFEGLSKNDK